MVTLRSCNALMWAALVAGARGLFEGMEAGK
jgi:hypothetical protein